LPGWQAVYEELADQGLEIIAVAEDTQGEAAAGPWCDRAGATFATLLARIIHEDVHQKFQVGSCRHFAGAGPGGDLVRSSRTPAIAKCRQGPRARRSRAFGASGVHVHE